MSETIRAELSSELGGWDICTANGLTDRTRRGDPILNLCRKLIAAGADPASPMDCYRDGKLVFQVRTIAAGAKWTVETHASGRSRFRGWRDHPGWNATEM